LETIQEKDEEKEESKQEFEGSKIEEWDEDEMGNLWDLYDKL